MLSGCGETVLYLMDAGWSLLPVQQRSGIVDCSLGVPLDIGLKLPSVTSLMLMFCCISKKAHSPELNQVAYSNKMHVDRLAIMKLVHVAALHASFYCA